MMIPENEGDRPEDISKEEITRVAREMTGDLGLIVNGSKNKICPSCGRVVMNKNWHVHQEAHRVHLRRRGDVKW